MHPINALVSSIILAVFLAGCGREPPNGAAPETPEGVKPGTVSAAQKKFLTIEQVGTSETTDMLALPGRITFRPQAQSAVGATVAGRVVAQLVRVGETVKPGTPVLVIESADATATRAALEQAATRLSAAERLYQRNVAMMDRGVGLESERQEAEARLKEARTEHGRAQQAVALIGAGQGGRVTVRAPTNGVVVSIRIAVGATVAPGGEPLLELGNPADLQVVAQVSEGDLGRIAVGQKADVDLPALAARTTARIESFSPRIEPESRRAQVIFSITKPISGLKAGMLAQIALRATEESAITLPLSAVLIKDGKRRVVYIEEPDGQFKMREVQTGRIEDGRVVILQGLAPGEKVVVRGALLLDTQAELLL